jgi:hypothetical protein
MLPTLGYQVAPGNPRGCRSVHLDQAAKLNLMDRLLEQVPTLMGVILGALATIGATTINDRLRWRRTQSVRWDERRLEAYAEYARAIKAVQVAASRLVADRIPGASTGPVDRDAGLHLLADAGAARTKAWEAVLLLGDATTVAAARDWREAIWQLEQIAADQSLGAAEWAQRLTVVDQSRDHFYEAARASLNVAGGSVAQAAWMSSKAPWLPLRTRVDHLAATGDDSGTQSA